MRIETCTNRTTIYIGFLQIDSNFSQQTNNEYITAKPSSACFAMMKILSLTKGKT